MFTQISKKAVNHLISKNIIKSDDHDIYLYGLDRFFTICLNILTILILGILFNLIIQSVVFAFSFMVLRTYTGGYHAKTPAKCYITTLISMIVTLSVIKFVPIHKFICLGLLLLSCLLIILLSPIGCANKPLDEIEVVVYRRRVVLICLAEAGAALAFLVLNIRMLYTPIIIADLLIGESLIFGIRQNQIIYKYNKKDQS